MVSAMHPRNAYSDLSRAISRRIGPPAGLSPADAGKAAADTASMLTRKKTIRMGHLHLDELVTRRRTTVFTCRAGCKDVEARKTRMAAPVRNYETTDRCRISSWCVL